MKPEPFRGKKSTLPDQPYDFDFFNHDDVQSAVEFYKKYWYSYTLLAKEQPEHARVYDEFIKKGKLLDYENWLFDYCFGDVLDLRSE